MILDERLTLKKHQKKLNTELRRRTGLLVQIAGSHHKPRANSDLSLKIFQSMVAPVVTYASAATCIRDDVDFENQDKLLRKAARIAIHAPKSARNEYVEKEANLTKSKQLTTSLARNYLKSEKRCQPIKDRIRAAENRLQPNAHDVKSPLQVILSP